MKADRIDFSGREDMEEVSEDGVAVLSWSAPEGALVEVQQAADAEFSEAETRYAGGDPGTVVTGLPEGDHYFRIRRSPDGGWSPPLRVRVQFVARWKLYLLMGLGGAVACGTVGAILFGHARTRREGGRA